MTAPTPPDYSAWKYRATLRITNPTTTANYPHVVTLTWKPGMRSDFRDIRFTQQDGINCPYWIQSKTDRSTATVYIKVPAASQRLILLYYGNGKAASESNGNNVFPFFDDFPGAALDSSKWTTDAGSPTVSGGILTVTGAAKISGKTTFGGDYIVRSRAAFPAQTSNQLASLGFGDYYDSDMATVIRYAGDGATRCFTKKTGTATEGATIGTWTTGYYTFTTKRVSTSSVVHTRDSTSATISTNIPTGSLAPRVCSRASYGGTVTVDWIYVMPYLATEPTLAVSITGINPTFCQRFGGALAGITLSAGTEYTFDLVNVDHGIVAGVGGQEIIQTTNINHGMTPGAGAQDVECGAVNIYHPIYPTASWAQIIDPVADSGYLISVTVSQSMDDAMAEAVFEYDGNEVGNYFSGDYGTKVHVTIPDHLGNNNCVFVGIVPSSRAVYDVAKDRMTVRAVDYGLFLSKQTLDIKDLSLLPPADQSSEGANVAKMLSYDGVIKHFQIGMTVTGKDGGATGTIIELAGTATRRLTLYPASGVFSDNEILMVGGVDYAVADGRSVDTSYTPYYSTISPEDWVRSVLGGDNWMRVSGVEPYSIESSAGYWDTEDCPAVPFMFGSLEKKRDALKRVATYMDYLWHVKPRSPTTGIYIASGYFIKQTSIDTLLDLPAAATITGPDDFAGPITLDQDGELQVDVVRVRCQDLRGNWIEEIRSNSYYDAGEGPYREFPDEPKDICTRADLAAYATDMYNLYSARTCSWSGTLLARSDLQLYQILNISGLGTEVPDGTYRIIKISHEHGCAKNLTHITFMLSSSFSTLRKYGMTYKDSISKVQQIVDGLEKQKFQAELGYVTASDGWTVTYETEAGNRGKGRDSTSTPDAVGVIPIGAKIQIQNTRGGVVCIPVIAASGSSTALLTVDVPTIVSAEADESDPNYWYLEWTPGENNQNVSVNFQTTAYPTTPGSVTGYGNDASCGTKLLPVSYSSARIRFSGPSATYYVALWGERNGVYSATSAKTTITSGAGVTPIDAPEEPEAFKQRATQVWNSAFYRSSGTKWFNDGFVMAAGTYRIDMTGWSSYWSNPDHWFENDPTWSHNPKHYLAAGAPGAVEMAVVVGTDLLVLSCGELDPLWYPPLGGETDPGITEISKVFAGISSTYSFKFTLAAPAKIGMRCLDSSYTDNVGAMVVILTQI